MTDSTDKPHQPQPHEGKHHHPHHHRHHHRHAEEPNYGPPTPVVQNNILHHWRPKYMHLPPAQYEAYNLPTTYDSLIDQQRQHSAQAHRHPHHFATPVEQAAEDDKFFADRDQAEKARLFQANAVAVAANIIGQFKSSGYTGVALIRQSEAFYLGSPYIPAIEAAFLADPDTRAAMLTVMAADKHAAPAPAVSAPTIVANATNVTTNQPPLDTPAPAKPAPVPGKTLV